MTYNNNNIGYGIVQYRTWVSYPYSTLVCSISHHLFCRRPPLSSSFSVHCPLAQSDTQFIIIIVHFMLAAYRLWHSAVQDLGILPIFSFSLPCFSASILMRSTSLCSFVCLLSTGTTLYQFNQKLNVKGKEKTKEMIMKDFQ